MNRIALSLGWLALSIMPLAAAEPPGLAGARILPGWTGPDGSRVAAIEFRLQPGWKTYWRSPGDSGLPPEFAWDGSTNLGRIILHWPAPEAIPSGDALALGYHDRLVLPFTAVPADPARPVDLAVAVDFGLCKDICVPAHVTMRADAPGQAPDPAITAALDRVPRPAADRPSCVLEPIADGLRVTATLPAGTTSSPVEAAAIELPGSDAWVSGTAIAPAAAGTVLTADVVPAQRGRFDLPREDLVFTVVDDSGAVELRGCAG